MSEMNPEEVEKKKIEDNKEFNQRKERIGMLEMINAFRNTATAFESSISGGLLIKYLMQIAENFENRLQEIEHVCSINDDTDE